jgi:predicted  nucleic acid-binding Zn-ribbon protein
MRLRTFTLTLLLASLLLLALHPQPSSSQSTSNRAAARSANPSAQQDSCADCRTQLQGCQRNYSALQREYGRLKDELSRTQQGLRDAQSHPTGGDVPSGQLRDLESQIERLKNENAHLRADLDSCRRQQPGAQACQRQLDALNVQLSNLRESHDLLSGQTAPLRSERDRLARDNNDLRGRNDELTRSAAALTQRNNDLNLRFGDLNRRINDLNVAGDNLQAQLREERANSAKLSQQLSAMGVRQGASDTQRGTLEQQLEKANTDLTDTTAQLRDAQRQNGELTTQLASAVQSSPQAPSALLAAAKAAQGASRTDEAAPFKMECGKTYIVRDLVIGTLRISYDEGSIKPGNTFLLNAEFTPRHLLNSDSLKGAAEKQVDWFMELQYEPQPEKLKAEYNRQQSGGKDQNRRVSLGGGGYEKWVWTVTLPKSFERESSDLVVFAEYKMDGGGERSPLLNETVKLVVPPGPGIVERVKENSTYILGVLSTLLGLRLGWLELRQKKAKDKHAPPDIQPETQPS